MKTLLCLLYCMAGISLASAQYSSRFSDLFSFLGNTGALAKCTQLGAGVYAENKFGLKELNQYIAAAQMPVATGAIALVTTYSGSVDYNRSQVGLAYGKSLGKINIGLRFNYNMARMQGYGNSGAISYAIGSTWAITEKLYSGVQFNSLPSIYSIGMGYECSDQLFISTAIAKEENKKVNVNVGIQYIIDKLLLILGINSVTSSPTFTAGYTYKDMRILAGGSFHPQLGASTSIGIIFSARQKDD